MGVCELSSSNNYYQGIQNPINININISHKTTESKSTKAQKDPKMNINIKDFLLSSDTDNDSNKKMEAKKPIQIININKINNYVYNEQTNFANYKRVPHIKNKDKIMSSDENKNIINKKLNNKIFFTEQLNTEENDSWFKTQYSNFNKVKKTNEFNISEYTKKKNDNNKVKRNLNNFIKFENKSQNNIKKNINMVYTKALPVDYNNEKKINNLFILNKNKLDEENNLLYIIENKENITNEISISNKYSNKKEYKNIINKYSFDKILLAKNLLNLKERQWYSELIEISNLLIHKRESEDILISKKYLRNITKLQEHFKWLIESLGIFFNYIIFGSENNNHNFINNDYNLPENDKMKWFQGFKWKGIYIRVIPNEKRKILLNEIKALNYFYFEYLQLLEQYEYNQENHLLYQLIFPLIAYTEINGLFLFGSAEIFLNNYNDIENGIMKENKGKDNYNSITPLITMDNIIENNNNFINYFSTIAGSINYNGIIKKDNKNNIEYTNLQVLQQNYYIKDLLTSRLFSELNIYHLIRLKENKFLIFNLSEFIPKLFEINSDKNIEMNFLSIINKKRVYYNTTFIQKVKINFKTSKSNNTSNINNNENYLNPKEVLKTIYNINPSATQLKSKDIIINNIYFRIIYEAQCIQENNYKNKQFVDLLFNYDKVKSHSDKNENYIVEPYVIIYDLIDSIKLKYSLIKSFYNENNNTIILNKMYYLSTNYISFFTSWCEMMNKNSFNIKNYSDLKKNMNKYGISSSLKFFALININNKEILDIIKISLLVKVIKFVFNKDENDIIINKLKTSKNINNVNKLIKYRKTKILYIINSILYTSEALSQSKQFIYNLFEDLVFYVNVIFLKLKLIDGYLSLGLLNIHKNNNMNISEISRKITGFDSPKNFLKHIINISREKPFIFITEMERKLKFIIDPYIKFKSSISIESMYNKLELKHISLNTNDRTKSYINIEELSGLILSKLIYMNESNIKKINTMINQKNINMKLSSNNTTNLAYKPTFMKTNINLSSYNNTLKKTENPLKLSTKAPIKITKNDINNMNDSDFIHIKNSKTNDSLNSSENISFIKLTERDICNKIILELPSICYKMSYSYENIFTKRDDFSKYLKNIYFLPELNIYKKWNFDIHKIFGGITSCDGEIEYNLLKTLIYSFIIIFFYEKKFEEANQINMKIKDIFKKGNFQLSLQDLAIINLFQALSSVKYIESETPYSKCLMLLLMSYGDPRGRNNDSHGILSFPLWKIARKTFKLDQTIINQYFREMFLCLEFFEKKKSGINLYNTKAKFNYSNNVYNVDTIKVLNDIYKNLNINNMNKKISDEFSSTNNESRMSEFMSNNTSENPENDFFANLSKMINIDATLDENIFNDKIVEKNIINYFQFPLINCTDENLDKIFFTADFVIYILKEIQSLLSVKKIKYNEEYINSHISNEIFNPYPYNYKSQIAYNTLETYSKDTDTESRNNMNNIKKINSNIAINNIDNNKFKQNIQVLPSKTNFINAINNRINFTLKAFKNKDEITLFPKNNKRATLNNEKNKNKSVEGIKGRNNILFSHFLYQELLKNLSYKLNSASDIVYSFGNNTHNETSHDNYEKITTPRMIFKLKNVRIGKIFSGWEHNILLSNKKEIYSFGNNHQYQCGLSNKNNISKIIKDPTNISVLNNNIRGISAACGNEYTLILSTDNEVYAFGNNEDGVLGINDSKLQKYEFTKINFGFYSNKIKEISSGTVHNLALTQDNKILSWGSSQGGQLGLPEKNLLSNPDYRSSFFISTPSLISFPSKAAKTANNSITNNIAKISCGEAHSLALTKNGEVYSWGFGSNGQLGLGFCEDSFEPGTGLTKSRIFTPQLIKALDEEKIIDIKCGKTFSMFINDKNELFACGVNDLNQLGIDEPFSKKHLYNKDISCYDFVYPIKVDCFLNMKVLKISCGEGHCLAVIKDLISNIRTIWSWGNNKFGQLGQDSLMKKFTPNPINYLSEYNSKSFEEISCGGFHSLCLIKYRENLSWIEDDFKKIVNIIDEIGII